MTPEQRFSRSSFAKKLRKGLSRDDLRPATGVMDWERDKSVLADWLKPNLTLAEIGRRNGNISGKRVNQVAERTARFLLVATGQFPELEGQDTWKLPRRPMTKASRLDRSRGQGGRLNKIAEAANRSTDPGDIAKEVGVEISRLGWYRPKLEAMGISIPRLAELREANPVRAALINPENYQGDFKDLLREVSYADCRKYLTEGLITRFIPAIRKLGYTISSQTTDRFAAILDEFNFPYIKVAQRKKTDPTVVIQNHDFLITNLLIQLEEKLKSHPEAQKFFGLNKLTQITETEFPLPKVSLFKNIKHYENVREVFRRLGLEVPTDIEAYLREGRCEVPVYRYNNLYRYPRKLSSLLEVFIIAQSRRNGY